jgi:hypothetical protein
MLKISRAVIFAAGCLWLIDSAFFWSNSYSKRRDKIAEKKKGWVIVRTQDSINEKGDEGHG